MSAPATSVPSSVPSTQSQLDPGQGQVASDQTVPIPISPRPAPPTPQEIQRKLGAPSVPPLSLSDPRAESDIQRRSSGSRHIVASPPGPSVLDEDDMPSSPLRATAALPLSAISEAEDGAGSGSDSDASSAGGARGESSSRPFANAMDKALDRLRVGRGDASPRIGDNAPVKSGYLMKKGERRKAWKKRWFVLRGGQVAMYKTDKEYQLLRLIPLSDIHTCAPIEFKKHANTFGIVTPKRTYYVKADSAADVADWCTKVERAKEDGRALATVTSLDTPGAETPGDVTPQRQQQSSPPTAISSLPGAIPIPSSSSPTALPIFGASSYATTSSISPSTPFASTLSTSALSSSYTSTSTAPLPAAAPRVPPNSFAATGLLDDSTYPNNNAHALELTGVDAGLESLLGAQAYPHPRAGSFSGSAGGGTSSGGEGRLAVPPSPGYFGARGSTSQAGTSPSSPSGVGSGGGGGMISSSEDDDGFDGYESFSPTEPRAQQLTFQDGTKIDSTRRGATNMMTTPQGKSSANTTDQPGGGVVDPNKVILSGYLMKQGKRRNWRKRWFVLMSGGLMYSRSHMDSKIHRQIPLARILDAIEFDPSLERSPAPSRRPLSQSSALSPSSPAAALAPAFEGGAKNYEHCFKIITPKRTYLVCAPSEEDEIAWLAALQCLVARRQVASPPAPTATTMPSSSAPKRSLSTSSQGGEPQPQSLPSTAPVPTATRPTTSGFEVKREASTTTAHVAHGRERSVTDAARAAVRDGVASFRESGGRVRTPGTGETPGQARAVRAG
ncbi:hypothetical protein RQP46_011494 [Phenoliferia psychrophenolica]